MTERAWAARNLIPRSDSQSDHGPDPFPLGLCLWPALECSSAQVSLELRTCRSIRPLDSSTWMLTTQSKPNASQAALITCFPLPSRLIFHPQVPRSARALPPTRARQSGCNLRLLHPPPPVCLFTISRGCYLRTISEASPSHSAPLLPSRAQCHHHCVPGQQLLPPHRPPGLPILSSS